MPQTLPLDAIPNQSISARLDGRRYVITIKEIGDMMAATVERDGVLLIENVRCVAGFPLLPYPHLSQDAGNLIFTHTVPGALPFYTEFGTTCQLVYSTAAEIAEAAANG